MMSTTITVYSQLPQQWSRLLSLFDLSLPRLLSGRLLRAILQAECVLSSKKDDEALLPRVASLCTLRLARLAISLTRPTIAISVCGPRRPPDREVWISIDRSLGQDLFVRVTNQR